MPPEIDRNKCDGIGACVEICPMDVLELKEDESGNIKVIVALPDDCTECGACVEECPKGAITLP
ncbi:MAG: ferredoxin family protein [Methanosarcinaceae archaeon]|nr:ferredoxin family protein [Methanosarcinaceae archaeon]